MKIELENGNYLDVYARQDGVTGSLMLNSFHHKSDGENIRFLVDCGISQGKDDTTGFKNEYIPFDMEKISFGIITHNHADHTGLIPLAVRRGLNAPIFMTYATYKLIDISLMDALKIQQDDVFTSSYDEEDVNKALKLMVGCCFKKIIKPHKHVRITFFSNGHLVGAAVTLVTITYPGEKDINIIYTGDYNNKNMFFNVERLPKDVRNMSISAIFCEATYGTSDSTDKIFEPCFSENLTQAIQNGKTVILPAFAQGRYQEILFICKMLQKNGLIPEYVKIWADGYTGQEYTKRYMYDELGVKKIMKNFAPKNLQFIPYRDRLTIRSKLFENSQPKIIIAPGGMMSYGAITTYISKYIPRNDALIHSLGYCSKTSKGYQLEHAEQGKPFYYNGMTLIKNCDFKKTGEFSAHAKRDELLKFLSEFNDVKSIIINHGEKEVKESFSAYLKEHLSPNIQIGIINSEIGFKITSDGIDESFQTNH